MIVRNDNHNTFDHVAQTLARVLPGRLASTRATGSPTRSTTAARRSSGSGPREPAEHYWEQLEAAGLTMAPLERA